MVAEDPGRRCAKACGSKLEPLIEIAQRDVDAAQDERQDQHDVASDDDGKAACPANLGGKNQKTQPDGEMGHDQRGQQNGLDRALEGERVAIERKGEGRSHQQGNGGGPAGDDEAIATA